MRNEYTVIWNDANGRQEKSFPASNGIECNEFWLQKIAENVDGLICIRPDGTAIMPKRKKKLAYAIIAKFDGCEKKYTYPSRTKPASDHTHLIVNSPYGVGLPRIVSYTEVEESALPGLCKTTKLNWIIGSFKKVG